MELQIRKWFRPGPSINVGDLVLVADDHDVPLVWELAGSRNNLKEMMKFREQQRSKRQRQPSIDL